jgi:hypothetical protein
LLSDRSHVSDQVTILGSTNNNHKSHISSAKRSRRLENWNSQKRRLNEQARLMKVKNFPPCFIKENANIDCNYIEYNNNNKKAYSEDRAGSRRHKRMNKSSKNVTESMSKINNHRSNLTMSENRKGKRMLLREKNQNKDPELLVNDEAWNQHNVSYKLKGLRSSKDSLVKLKNWPLKNVKSEASFLPDTKIGLKRYSTISESNSMESIYLKASSKDINDYWQPLFARNEIMTKEFSHMSRLAQGLALNATEEIPFNLAFKNNKKDAISLNAKLSIIPFKRRRNSDKGGWGSFRGRRLVKSKSEVTEMHK